MACKHYACYSITLSEGHDFLNSIIFRKISTNRKEGEPMDYFVFGTMIIFFSLFFTFVARENGGKASQSKAPVKSGHK
jgi:hypothetical protein